MTLEMKQLMVDAGKYAQDAVLKFQMEQAEAAKKELVAGGLVVSQLEDEDQWKQAALDKVWPEMADFVGGKEAINDYLTACGKLRLEVTRRTDSAGSAGADPASDMRNVARQGARTCITPVSAPSTAGRRAFAKP